MRRNKTFFVCTIINSVFSPSIDTNISNHGAICSFFHLWANGFYSNQCIDSYIQKGGVYDIKGGIKGVPWKKQGVYLKPRSAYIENHEFVFRFPLCFSFPNSRHQVKSNSRFFFFFNFYVNRKSSPYENMSSIESEWRRYLLQNKIIEGPVELKKR